MCHFRSLFNNLLEKSIFELLNFQQISGIVEKKSLQIRNITELFRYVQQGFSYLLPNSFDICHRGVGSLLIQPFLHCFQRNEIAILKVVRNGRLQNLRAMGFSEIVINFCHTRQWSFETRLLEKSTVLRIEGIEVFLQGFANFVVGVGIEGKHFLEYSQFFRTAFTIYSICSSLNIVIHFYIIAIFGNKKSNKLQPPPQQQAKQETVGRSGQRCPRSGHWIMELGDSNNRSLQ